MRLVLNLPFGSATLMPYSGFSEFAFSTPRASDIKSQQRLFLEGPSEGNKSLFSLYAHGPNDLITPFSGQEIIHHDFKEFLFHEVVGNLFTECFDEG